MRWRVLSGKQPWWWAILSKDLPSPKRVENRRRLIADYRGEILLHASTGASRRYVGAAMDWMVGTGLAKHEDWPGLHNVQRGGIIGRAVIKDVIRPGDEEHRARLAAAGVDMRWWMPDQFGFVLEDVRPVPFFPCRGMLGLWSIEDPKLDEHLAKAVA